MFESLSEKFSGTLRKLSGRGKISEGNIREAMDDVRTALLEADVHYEVAEKFCDNCIEAALGTEVLSSLKPGQQMRMPVLYYVDPAILEDPETKDIEEITLSYTFYRSKDGQAVDSAGNDS